jgi:GNAT superfamily N-acetyltransferase
MITCLSIRTEFKGRRVAGLLLDALEAAAARRGHGAIEVLAFADRHGWQPVSLYGKRDYQAVKEIDGLFLMRKPL